MHSFDLISTLTVGFIAALLLGYAAHRAGLSPIVGYLLAGILVGEHTPGPVANRELAEQLAEIGVVLLMFGVGLQFHIRDLVAVRRIAISGAPIASAAATAMGAVAAHWLGWSWASGLVFGLSLSVASTVVLIRVLSDRGELQSPAGRIAMGWLVVEDVLTVFALVLLPVVVAGSGGLAMAMGMAALKLAAFSALVLAGGSYAVPWLLGKVAATRSRELFALSVFAIALGIAVGSAYVFQLSMALGAFLAGVVVGQSDFSARAGAEALPLRDAFAVMFFLSVGLLFDPGQALQSPWLIAAAISVVMLVKPVVAFLIVTAMGYGTAIAIEVGLSLAQIGEFSFLLAALAKGLGVLPAEASNAIVATAIVTIMVNPLLCRLGSRTEAFLERHPRLWRAGNWGAPKLGAAPESRLAVAHRTVLVGYGPIGRLVGRILARRGIGFTVIEMNLETHRRLVEEGHTAVYGDANRAEVLESAGIRQAESLVLSASGAAGSTEAIRVAREMNAGIHVVARADFLRETAGMRRAGADEVFSGEGEVAMAMTDSILRRLGATPEQLDEAREAIRRKLIEEQV